MKISVLVATYNGEKYICEQLNSILNQELKVDEVIICDDCSTDNTVDIINKFISDNKLYNWSIIVNEVNMGWKKNFIYNMRFITGDIVFFCDQDDIWDTDKVKIMSNIMKEKSEILALSCYVRLIDEKGNDLPLIKKVVANGKDTQKVYKYNFDKNFIYSSVAGCTMCIRRQLYDLIKDKDLFYTSHDSLFWQLAILNEGAYNIDKVLLSYRVHSTNATNANKNNIGKTSMEKRIFELKNLYMKCKEFLNIIESCEFCEEKSLKKEILHKSMQLLNFRMEFLEKKKISRIKDIFFMRRYLFSKNVLWGDISYFCGMNEVCGNLLWKIYKNDIK